MSKTFDGAELSQEEREFIHNTFSSEKSFKDKPLYKQSIKLMFIGIITFVVFYKIGAYIIKIYNNK